MRRILVSCHKSFGREICIYFGVLLLISSIVCFFMSFGSDSIGFLIFELFLSFFSFGFAVVMFLATDDEYADMEPPMYFTVDQYGRNVATNGEKTVVLGPEIVANQIHMNIKTHEEAKEALKIIEEYREKGIISESEYERGKIQFEAFLRGEKIEVPDTTEVRPEPKQKVRKEIDFSFIEDHELYERFSLLKQLYDDDIISEDEYERKKEELLEEL